MASAYFLQMGDIKGDSTDDKHKEWIDILSFNFGTRSYGRGAREGGAIQVDDITITKRLDSSSVELANANLVRKLFKAVTIEACTESGDKARYLMITLKDAVVINYSFAASPEGKGSSLDTFTVEFGEIEVQYTAIDSQGRTGNDKRLGWRRSTQ